MTKHLRFLFVMLLAMIWSAGWAQTTVFHETFDKCTSTGGNDGKWAASSGGSEINSETLISKNLDNVWTGLKKIYPANKCVKVASGSGASTMTTPTINSTGDFLVKIKAGACSGKLNVQLTVKTTAGTLDKSSVSLTAGKFNEYSIELSGVTKAFTLTFTVPDSKQSFIDDVEVINKASADTKKDPGISFGETTYTANITDKDDAFHSYVTLNNPNNLSVTYASSKTDVAEVNAAGEVKVLGLGTTTISATFAGDDTYTAASAEYTLNVIDPNKTDVTFDFTDPEKYGYEKPTTTTQNIILSDGDKLVSSRVTITNVKGGSSTPTRFSIRKASFVTLRAYKGAILTVEAPAGFAINRIDFTDNGSQTVDNFTFSTGELNSKTWTGLAKNLTMTVDDKQVFLKNMTVNLVKLVELDENSESNTIEAKTGVNVTLKRTMVANEWNTICLPFAVTMDKAKAAFGDNVKIVKLDTEAAVDANVLSFKPSTGIVAATPYLIKPSAVSETGTYTFEGVDITETNDEKAYSFNNVTNPIAFKGIYNMVDITKDVVGIGDNYYAAFLGAGNKIYKTDGSGNKTKGFRAYFAIPNGAAASALRVVIDGTATSIKNIDSEVVESNAPVYNLQGQRVNGNNLTPGIYVKAGKKFVVK